MTSKALLMLMMCCSISTANDLMLPITIDGVTKHLNDAYVVSVRVINNTNQTLYINKLAFDHARWCLSMGQENSGSGIMHFKEVEIGRWVTAGPRQPMEKEIGNLLKSEDNVIQLDPKKETIINVDLTKLVTKELSKMSGKQEVSVRGSFDEVVLAIGVDRRIERDLYNTTYYTKILHFK